MHARPVGKIKVTIASADQQGEIELFFEIESLAYSSTTGTFFTPNKHLWECIDSFSVDLCKNTGS